MGLVGSKRKVILIYEELLKHDPQAVQWMFRAFNQWLKEDWGFAYQDKIFAAPYISLCDLDWACRELEWAIAEVLRRALKHTVVNRERPLQIDNRLMHQHPAREARLIERTLRNGIVHPDVLHSFQHDRRTRRPMPLRPANMGPDPEDLPDFDLHVLDTTYNYEHPSHLDVRRGEYVSKMHQPAGHTSLVVGRMPQVGRGDGLAAHV